MFFSTVGDKGFFKLPEMVGDTERYRKYLPLRYYKTIYKITNLHLVICGLYYKTFRIVIYNRNDSTIVEPVL
jgi:hypothetical protein